MDYMSQAIKAATHALCMTDMHVEMDV